MARDYKWLCIEAISALDGQGVRWLVTDSAGNYAGVEHREVHGTHIDAVERYQPCKRVKRESVELLRAIARGMLIAHYPAGMSAERGDKPCAIAETMVEAFEAFGVDHGDPKKANKAKPQAGRPTTRSKKKAD